MVNLSFLNSVVVVGVANVVVVVVVEAIAKLIVVKSHPILIS